MNIYTEAKYRKLPDWSDPEAFGKEEAMKIHW